MPRLTEPSPAFHASFLAAMKEREDERVGEGDPRATAAEEIQEYTGVWESAEGFRRYLERVRAAEDERTPWHPGWVGSTTLWWTEGDEYLGRLSLRHRLTTHLYEQGGHIGYHVRPSARGQGHATAMLCASLPYARELGIVSVLLTCDVDNDASRTVIERCGGVLEDRRGRKLRYWIATE
ncbi:GNAT family N-acetyltransferase [Streptomyces sp. NPDC048172]|uniref:GNAT family N-acetyltransferase n=1 Tax=Streptomyces sp. NPDC048172 TaxID=3365505 RepID=UPI00371EAD02